MGSHMHKKARRARAGLRGEGEDQSFTAILNFLFAM